MSRIGKTRSKRGGAKRRRTVLFQDGLGALSVAAFLFLGATIREVNLLMALGSFFAGFAVLDYWQGRRSLRRLRVARRLPDAIFAGKPFDVEIEIDATRRRSTAWGSVVEDEWTLQEGERELLASVRLGQAGNAEGRRGKEKRGKTEKKEERRKKGKREKKDGAAQEEARPHVAATARPVAFFPKVKGGERRRERYVGLVARRGVRRLATLTASTRFPCGFFRSSEKFDAPAEILVFPKIGVLTERWDALVGAARREAIASTARTSRSAGETATVRDWRPDDSKKAIHWRATAKRDKLQARDFEKRENSVKILILDLVFNKANGEDAQESARRSALVEKAVAFAATLLDRWARSNGAKFLLAINGDDSAASQNDGRKDSESRNWEKWDAWGGRAESGNGALRRALTRLATVEAPRRDRWGEIAASLDPRTLANAEVFIVSVAPFGEKTGELGEMEEMSEAAVSGRRNDERWDGARKFDVSTTDFDDYFAF
ncbi:MAG: DUF58 domain-containing protein [Thermoguttaceae bacterium]|nr:DUF58 domain-containing protein [Thermoguttaceae bacterium]